MMRRIDISCTEDAGPAMGMGMWVFDNSLDEETQSSDSWIMVYMYDLVRNRKVTIYSGVYYSIVLRKMQCPSGRHLNWP